MKCLILTCEKIEGIAKEVTKDDVQLVYVEDKAEYYIQNKEELMNLEMLYDAIGIKYGVNIRGKKLTSNTALIMHNNDVDIVDGYIFMID